jgi:plasmid stabilization system protein ParE
VRNLEYSQEARERLLELKMQLTEEYGENVAKRILSRITKNIRNLTVFDKEGVSLSAILGVECDYRYFYTEHNYVFYRIENDTIKVVTILHEKQDFLQILFGIKTVSDEEDW